ncbi:hypothetical protein HAX54_006279 [Datura stramonium]|uniref:Uncharacterized protein n=1 Tax=Datura stramonium TaxID=4076 RepID=A0ABS8TAV7_DATST|nr:hypothetical protein [Datura stramonium]
MTYAKDIGHSYSDLDPSKEMKSEFCNRPVNGSMEAQSAARNSGLTGNENVKVASTTRLLISDIPDAEGWEVGGRNDELIELGRKGLNILGTGGVQKGHLLGLILLLSRLVDIMRTFPDLQRKAVSILEFAAVIEPCGEKILSIDLETGLDAVFQQKTLNGMRDYYP